MVLSGPSGNCLKKYQCWSKIFPAFFGSTTVCVFVGAARYEQRQKLEEKLKQILVATLRNLIDLMDSGQVDVMRVSHLGIGESDRVHDICFGPGLTRPRKQNLTFSTTWPKTVWQLSKYRLQCYTKDIVGSQRFSGINQITYLA